MNEYDNLKRFLINRMIERMNASLSNRWFVIGDGKGHCKLFTKADRDNMRAFLDAHKN